MAKRFAKGRSKARGRFRGQESRKLKQELEELLPEDGRLEDALDEHADAIETWHRPPPAPEPPRPQTSTPSAKTESAPAGEGLQIGRVIALASGLCEVQGEGDDEGEIRECVLPSALARRQQSSLAVGDRVRYGELDSGVYRVEEVVERKSVLSRPDPHNPRLERVLAANVDVAVIVASLKEPALRPALIDRFLIVIQRGGAEALVALNKIDLASPEERSEALETLKAYRELGLELVPVSAATGEGIPELRRALAGKTAVVVGHSGVGKSSLLNALSGERHADVGAVASASGRGRHTTTQSRLYHLEGEIDLIDTPGIRELGLFELDARTLGDYFPEFADHAAACRFNDCSHSHEPGCAVRPAAEAGEIPMARYAAYLRILESLGQGA